MPAITLGLAEIEERLHVLRRRLNTVTVLHAASLSLSTVFLVGAALVAVGLRGGVASFRAVTWVGFSLAAGTLVAGVISARRRWLDVAATAALADQRGQLTDRLTTLVDLRSRPRPSRLAPVLIAQALALGESWRPQRIAPRRVPRSLFLLLLSLLVLTASPLVAPAPPPATAPAQAAKHQLLSPDSMENGAVPKNGSLAGNDRTGAAVAAGHDPPAPAADVQSPQMQAEPARQVPPAAESPRDAQLALLPDRLRNAILSAFHAEQTGRGDGGGQLAKGAKGESREPAPASGKDDRAGAKPDGNSGRRSGEAGKPAPERDAGTQASQHPGDSHAGGQPEHVKNEPSDQTQSGSAPNAGTGTSPENLLGTAVTAAEPGHGGATTFKMTITSFLHAVEEKGNQPRRSADRGGAAVAANAGDTEPALNAQQLRDDALRKAEIPPEYEDIVRRVYSARADQ